MKSITILSAFCSVLVSCALCSCSDQQPLNSSELGDIQQSAADTISSEASQDSSDDSKEIYSNSKSASAPTVSEPQRYAAGTSESSSADNEDIPTYSMKIYSEQKYDSNSVPIPQGFVQYIDFNGVYYLRTGFGSCTFSESEGDYYDEDNESLCFAASRIGQEQITEYSQWYEFIAMQECVGSITDFPSEKIFRISDEFLVTEELLENGSTAYTLWELWENTEVLSEET